MAACFASIPTMVVVWDDERQDRGVYAQNIDIDGNLGVLTAIEASTWTPELQVAPIPLTTASNILLPRDTSWSNDWNCSICWVVRSECYPYLLPASSFPFGTAIGRPALRYLLVALYIGIGIDYEKLIR